MTEAISGERIPPAPRPAQVTPVACWTLDCADCGADWADVLDAYPHFPSVAEAEKQAVEVFNFSRAKDDTLRCPECTEKARCAAAGRHRWSSWHESAKPDGAVYRWCEVCDEGERQLPEIVELPAVSS